MKPIQVLIDEPLLARLDAHVDVRKHGRAAVLRRAAAEYLRRHRRAAIASAYQRGYGTDRGLGVDRGLGSEYAGWSDEGAWPEP